MRFMVVEGRMGYSLELNPNGFVWKCVKHQKVGEQTITDKADLTVKVMRCLRSLQKPVRGSADATAGHPHIRTRPR